VEGGGQTVHFKQIAGLIARRIVFTNQLGETIGRGERIGLMKFGSRMDVFFDASAILKVKLGDKVVGGSTILAIVPVAQPTTNPTRVPTAERA